MTARKTSARRLPSGSYVVGWNALPSEDPPAREPEVVARAAAVLRARSVDLIHRGPGAFAHLTGPLSESAARALAADLHAAGLLASEAGRIAVTTPEQAERLEGLRDRVQAELYRRGMGEEG